MKLGKYELVEKLGEGGFGEVWRATGPYGPCAVKRLHDSSPTFREALQKEGAKLLQLLNVPGIVRLLDWDLAVAEPYLVLELADGNLLDQIKGPMAPILAARYAVEICRAVNAAHGRGVMHRDIKPDNILVKSGVVKIADFGLGKGAGSLLLTVGGAGTPGYMAPEGVPSVAFDVFGIGATFFHMLTGQRPRENRHSLDPRHFAPCPTELAELVKWTTAEHPVLRPSIDMIISQLEVFIASSVPAAEQSDSAVGMAIVFGAGALLAALFAGRNRYDRDVGRYRDSNGKFRSGWFD